MAKLYFRYGAMNCGKTTNLLQVAHNYGERGMKAIILKPGTDKKGGDAVMSRLGITRQVDMLLTREDNVIQEVKQYISKHGHLDCILVDEVQFFSKEQIDQLFEVAVRMKIPTICYGLRTDFKVNGFEGSERLLLLAHSLRNLKQFADVEEKQF